jgi:hypothetical protein
MASFAAKFLELASTKNIAYPTNLSNMLSTNFRFDRGISPRFQYIDLVQHWLRISSRKQQQRTIASKISKPELPSVELLLRY